ncbi:MAG TPA: NAD(P)H-dependent oxidoreductase [Spirochaetia bacterium]|nr:NAD(P)H-dependent oxidoreductase [Spirochaetia bacterium]
MNVSLILAHPDKYSFNRAIAETALDVLDRNSHTVFFHDLYEENFAPVLLKEEIPKNAPLDPLAQSYCHEISESDGIIIVHPNWWGQPPAILKGWVDRIIRPGVAYEFAENDGGEGIPVGLLKADTALVFNTSNTPKERETNLFLDPLETIWKNCIFGLCGIGQFYHRMFRTVVTSSPEQRLEWLKEVEQTVAEYFPRSRNSTFPASGTTQP